MADEAAASRALIELARQAKAASYSPYSAFPVGAAVRLRDGRIFTGTNIENASYGLTCCAERAGIFNAVSVGAKPGDFAAIAVSCGPPGAVGSLQEHVPCGACRQVIAEFFPADAQVIVDLGENTRSFTVEELLPTPFSLR